MPPEVARNWVKAAPQVGRASRGEESCDCLRRLLVTRRGRRVPRIFYSRERSRGERIGEMDRGGGGGILEVGGEEESGKCALEIVPSMHFQRIPERDANRRKYARVYACAYPRRSRSFEQQSVKKLVPFLMRSSPSAIPFPPIRPRILSSFVLLVILQRSIVERESSNYSPLSSNVGLKMFIFLWIEHGKKKRRKEYSYCDSTPRAK